MTDTSTDDNSFVHIYVHIAYHYEATRDQYILGGFSSFIKGRYVYVEIVVSLLRINTN